MRVVPLGFWVIDVDQTVCHHKFKLKIDIEDSNGSSTLCVDGGGVAIDLNISDFESTS